MKQPIVGHVINHFEGLVGAWGQGYNYILAGNGVYICAESSLIKALVPVCEGKVRGIAPLEPQVTLIHGKIPRVLFDLAINAILAVKEKEKYLAITWDNGYHLFDTRQEGTGGEVKYDVLEHTILDIHSHPGVEGFFSPQDDIDEQGFRLSCTIGNLKSTPLVLIRTGVYGNFYPLLWNDVFDGVLTGATENPEEIILEGEVTLNNEVLYKSPEAPRARKQWWHIFR